MEPVLTAGLLASRRSRRWLLKAGLVALRGETASLSCSISALRVSHNPSCPAPFWTLPPRRGGPKFASQNFFGAKSSRNHKPLRAAKLNQIHRDGQLNYSFGPLLAPSTVNASHELTECNRLTGGMGFHRQFLRIFNHIPTL